MVSAYQVNLGRVVFSDLILISKCFGDNKYLYLSDVSFAALVISLVVFKNASKFIGSLNFKENWPLGLTFEIDNIGVLAGAFAAFELAAALLLLLRTSLPVAASIL